jgi:hypothetical protein
MKQSVNSEGAGQDIETAEERDTSKYKRQQTKREKERKKERMKERKEGSTTGKRKKGRTKQR